MRVLKRNAILEHSNSKRYHSIWLKDKVRPISSDVSAHVICLIHDNTAVKTEYNGLIYRSLELVL